MALTMKTPHASQPRRWGALVLCLLMSVVLLIAYQQESEEGPLHSFQGVCAALMGPVTGAGEALEGLVYSASTSLEDLDADADTLTALRQQNEELRVLAAQAEEYRQENDRLQGLINTSHAYGIDGVVCNIIGRNSGSWSRTITLDGGARDGIVSGMTVMGVTGVIGQVIEVTETTCTVRLITDSQAGVAAILQSNRAEGIVNGSIDGLLYLGNVDSDVEVLEGDVVITSGLGGSFVRGLIIGTVVRVDTSQGSALRSIVVKPNESIDGLEMALVVKSLSTEGEATPLTLAAEAEAKAKEEAEAQARAEEEAQGGDVWE